MARVRMFEYEELPREMKALADTTKPKTAAGITSAHWRIDQRCTKPTIIFSIHFTQLAWLRCHLRN